MSQKINSIAFGMSIVFIVIDGYKLRANNGGLNGGLGQRMGVKNIMAVLQWECG